MKISKSILAVIFSLSAFTHAQTAAEIPASKATAKSQPAISKEKRVEIERMLELTGMEKMTGQMISQMIGTFKQQMSDVPESYWASFEKAVNPRELIDLIIPIYDKYYTVEDLKAVNAFYSTPTGQKMMSTLPQVMQESMKAGQEWGMKLGQRAAQEARQKKN